MLRKPLLIVFALVAIISATHATIGGNRPDLRLPTANAQQSENR